ncbi:hypothetical protein GOBAR_AA14257 [Gossypium barbadense]|uniref:ER membrane protein complex subunit 1 n=1 Tax=Gossypium barbadense TaxID=3634 RepID=A0A2P5XSQ0_GOSBA|nr:hypothetical protein GOBAR_AA14257 [Gossypium barbadense]
MAIRSFFLFILFFSSSISPVFSLYEDQVGLMDWHQQYIGKVKQAVFSSQRAGRKRVVVSTEENVIASLDLRHGEIFWRHLLGADDVIDGIDIGLGKYVITLSSGGSILRSWNLPDGQMVWESSLQGPKHSKSFLLVPTNLKFDKDNLLVVFNGEVLWKKDFEAESFEVQQVILPPGSDLIHVVGFAALSQFEMYQINAKNGELLKHESASFSSGFSGQVSLVSTETVVALDSTGSILLTISFQDGKISSQQTPISNLVEDSLGPAVIIPSSVSGIFAIKTDAVTIFIRVIGKGNLEVVEKTTHEIAVSDALSISEDQQAFALIQHASSEIHLTVKLAHDWDGNLLKESVKMDRQRGLVHKVFINNYIRTDRSYGFRVLIVMEDHSLLLLQQGEIVWSREDGLASIIDVTTSELPVERDGVSVAKVEHNLFEWLKGHMLKLKGTLMLASPEDMAAIQSMRLKSSEKSKMTRDHNGFRKLLIVLTRAGKLFALHTGDGRIVWSYLLRSLHKSEACQSPIGLNLYQIHIKESTFRGNCCTQRHENWVVYHYFNLRAHRYEMSVIEIYDQSRADNKDVWKLVLGKHNLTSPISLFSRPEVITKSQSYFFTHSLKAIAVTSTAKGITSKQLLLGTIGDQVLALDKRFLDPRRTVNPTQLEKEEGIIPLTESLPIIPQSYVTHALRVEGLRGIITVPAKLESTTLVFAHGVDLFFTQLAPSRTYDSLTEDFSYALLLITIVALVAAIFVTWRLSERKELQEKWSFYSAFASQSTFSSLHFSDN